MKNYPVVYLKNTTNNNNNKTTKTSAWLWLEDIAALFDTASIRSTRTMF